MTNQQLIDEANAKRVRYEAQNSWSNAARKGRWGMQAMCLNCAFYDPMEPPYCNFHMGYTAPESICDLWMTNKQPTPDKEEA